MLQFRHLKLLLTKRAICTSPKLKGYIVLVPEIGEDNDNGNSLINSDGLPKFNHLTVENCLASIGKQAGTVEKTVKNIEENIKKADKNEINLINDVFNPLEDATSELETIWGVAKTLYLGNSSLMPTKYYLNIHDRAKRARASKFNSHVLYDTISKSDFSKSSSEEKRLAEKYLLEGKLNGLHLPESNKNILSNILSDLSKERNTYKHKVDIAVRQFTHKIQNYSLVRNFPPEFLMSVAVDSNHPTRGPWKISLQPQIVSDFLKYCPDRKERWNVWQADIRKASGLSDKSIDNSTHIEIIRSLRRRQAEILGYKNFASMSMQTKMLKTVENARALFETLAKHAKFAQNQELDILQNFAEKNGFEYKLDIYDIPYWRRKHLMVEHDLDEEILREYFPLPHVMQKVIELCEKLFEIKFIEKKDPEVWHPSVKYYDLFNSKDSSKPIAGLYLDFYSRENGFRNSGWMVGIRNRSQIKMVRPLSALIFNFGTPIYGKSHLLTINDLKIVLKNFGNALQHLLTQAKYTDIAGLSNIEWDAAEICGYVMQNFLEDGNVLKSLSCHYSTEETLTDNKVNSIKVFNSNLAGYDLCRQLYLSDLDLELHISKEFWVDVVKKLWPNYIPHPFDKKNYHPCSMIDIFSGDWAAAYFSHLYSKVIADDIFSSFNEKNSNEGTSTSMKRRFRDLFLHSDGTLSTAEIFRRFRGRDPSPLPLLKRSNILQSSHSNDI